MLVVVCAGEGPLIVDLRAGDDRAADPGAVLAVEGLLQRLDLAAGGDAGELEGVDGPLDALGEVGDAGGAADDGDVLDELLAAVLVDLFEGEFDHAVEAFEGFGGLEEELGVLVGLEGNLKFLVVREFIDDVVDGGVELARGG